MKKLFPFLLVLLSHICFAQVTKVKDLRMGTPLYEVNNKLLFAANDSNLNQYDLWMTDGTTAGTQLLKTFSGGMWEVKTVGYNYYSPSVFHNELYFLAELGSGPQLWKSDGTLAGTVLVKSFSAQMTGPFGDNYPFFCEMNNELFFAAADQAHGVELWKTDGTTVGTVLVKDIAADTYYGSAPSFLTSFNNELYFSAYDETHGVEIFKSDGTEAGTQILKDIFPGTDGVTDDGYGGSIDPQFTVSGPYLYFAGRKDLINSTYLYRTDGTDAGTILLSDTITKYDPLDYHKPWQADVNGEFYFFGYPPNSLGSTLYKSDGSTAGTVNVATNNNLIVDATFYAFDGKLYFHGEQNNNAQNGLCVSDGTTAGTSMIYPFPFTASSPDILDFINTGNSFFFRGLMAVGNSGTSWRMVQSNGTATGTVIYYGAAAWAFPHYYNGDVYFYGLDTVTNNQFALYKLIPLNVGVHDIPESENFQVFPNPVSSQLVISGNRKDEKGIAQVFDLEGRMVLQASLTSSVNTLDVTDLPSAVYLLKISSGEDFSSEKITVMH